MGDQPHLLLNSFSHSPKRFLVCSGQDVLRRHLIFLIRHGFRTVRYFISRHTFTLMLSFVQISAAFHRHELLDAADIIHVHRRLFIGRGLKRMRRFKKTVLYADE